MSKHLKTCVQIGGGWECATHCPVANASAEARYGNPDASNYVKIENEHSIDLSLLAKKASKDFHENYRNSPFDKYYMGFVEGFQTAMQAVEDDAEIHKTSLPTADSANLRARIDELEVEVERYRSLWHQSQAGGCTRERLRQMQAKLKRQYDDKCRLKGELRTANERITECTTALYEQRRDNARDQQEMSWCHSIEVNKLLAWVEKLRSALLNCRIERDEPETVKFLVDEVLKES